MCSELEKIWQRVPLGLSVPLVIPPGEMKLRSEPVRGYRYYPDRPVLKGQAFEYVPLRTGVVR